MSLASAVLIALFAASALGFVVAVASTERVERPTQPCERRYHTYRRR